MNIEILRMVERLANILIAGGSIYFGYRLFLSVPLYQDGEGKFHFPGGSVHISRTGPGVFFALFGCIIIITSFTNPIKITGKEGHEVFSGIGEGVSKSGGSYSHQGNFAKREKAEVEKSIGDMNSLQLGLKDKIDNTLFLNVQDKVHTTKILLIGFYSGNINDPDLRQFGLEINGNPAKDFSGNVKFKEWAALYNY